MVATNRDLPNVRAKPEERTRSSAPSIAELMERYPYVQLATLVDAVPEGANWVHEIKFDGYRLLGFHSGQTVRLITRNGKDWTGAFPSLGGSISISGGSRGV